MAKKPTIRESVIESYLRKQVILAGGLCWKFTSPGTNGVPDRVCIMNGNIVFVELKRPGGKPRTDQIAIHKLMAIRGVATLVIDSKKQVDELVAMMKKNQGTGGW